MNAEDIIKEVLANPTKKKHTFDVELDDYKELIEFCRNSDYYISNSYNINKFSTKHRVTIVRNDAYEDPQSTTKEILIADTIKVLILAGLAVIGYKYYS